MISLDNIHYLLNVFNQVINLIILIFLDTIYSLGYRHIHLYTIGGDLIANAYLFVHIVINSKSLAVVCFLSLMFTYFRYNFSSRNLVDHCHVIAIH